MALAALIAATPTVAETPWRQWGGPSGDFTSDATGLAGTWSEKGPAQVWSRKLGEGNSTILHEDGVLYTMYRSGDKDVVIAIDAATGKTIWEYPYNAPAAPGMLLDYGVGPRSTPLIAGDRIYTMGCMTHFNCLDKRTGKLIWSKNLAEELEVSDMLRGYGSSLVGYKDSVIVNIGSGRGAKDPSGLAAFSQDTGKIVWKSQRLGAGYPTPIVASFNGQDMLIDCLGTRRFALDPSTGEMLWEARVDGQSASIITSPLWVAPDKVFFSAGHGGGSRLYQIKVDEEGKYTVDERWYYHKMRIMHANAVQVGSLLVGSSGDLGSAYLMGVGLDDGKLKWRGRGFAKATLVAADGKLIILDEDGYLGLATATPERIEIHAKAKVLEKYAWSVPTLIGTRLYLRDDATLKCLDLGVTANQ